MAMHSVHLSRPREGVSTPREGVSRPREGVSYTLSHTIHLIHLTCNVKIHMCPSLWTYGLDVWAPFVKADTCKATRLDVSAPFVVCLFGCLPASLTVSDARACDRKEAPTGWAWTRWKRLWRSDKATYPFPSSSCRCPPCIAVPQDRVVDALLMWSSLSQCLKICHMPQDMACEPGRAVSTQRTTSCWCSALDVVCRHRRSTEAFPCLYISSCAAPAHCDTLPYTSYRMMPSLFPTSTDYRITSKYIGEAER